jgi:hypothetical protein
MTEAPRRIRSPNYPALSLPEAIERIESVFERERQHSMSKEVALKGMGYSGVNGAALGTLSAVVKYGLLEKNGENYRVTSRAVSILHPKSVEEKHAALREAAFAPALFAELAEEFPGGSVSDDNLRSYLVRRDFSSGALSGVISAFRETMQLVSFDQEKPPQLALPAPVNAAARAGGALTQQQMPAMSNAQVAPTTAPSSWVLSTNGQVLTVHAQLDNAKSVDKLIRVLEANKLLLPQDEPSDTESNQTAQPDADA